MQYIHRSRRILPVLAMAGALALAQGQTSGSGSAAPRVLRPLEPADNRVVMLPGAHPARPARVRTLKTFTPPKPAAIVATVPSLPAPPAIGPVSVPPLPALPGVTMPSGTADEADPITSPAPPPAPEEPPHFADLEAESALFLQKRISHWKLADAQEFLGKPTRQRPALDDNMVENGIVYAFEDPSGRYKEVELDFDGASGILRTVFIYPWHMTWQECRQQFAGTYNATAANKGRIFYSYVTRRMDVLVSPEGQVISLGLY